MGLSNSKMSRILLGKIMLYLRWLILRFPRHTRAPICAVRQREGRSEIRQQSRYHIGRECCASCQNSGSTICKELICEQTAVDST